MKLFRLLFIAGILLVWAFSPLSSEVLRFATSNTQTERLAELRYLCDAFELYYPSIEVEIIPFSDETPMSLIGDQGTPVADILIADSPILHMFADKGFLNRFLSTDILNELMSEPFYAGALSAFKDPVEASEYIGIPFTAWLQLIWYRKDVFQNLGIAVPENPESILQTARLIINSGIMDYGCIIGTAEDRYLQQSFYQMSGGRLNEKTFALYRNLAASAPKGELTSRARDYYFQNRAPMLIYSTHLMDDLAIDSIGADSLTGKHFSDLTGTDSSKGLLEKTGFISALSYGDDVKSFGSVSGWGIFNTGISPDLVKKFINFFYREDVYLSYLHMSPGGMLPVRPSILESDNFYRDSMGVFLCYGKDNLLDICSGIENIQVLPADTVEPEVLYKRLWAQNGN